MDIKYSLLLISTLTAALLSAQPQTGTKGIANNGGTFNLTEKVINAPLDMSQFTGIKTPNKNWKAPEFTTDPDQIIYKEKPGTAVSGTHMIRQQSPAPVLNFSSAEDNQRSIPPDVNGVAGLNHVMTTLNTEVNIRDKEGNLIMTTALGTFWSPLPGYGNTFDPKILYDPYNDRWIMTTPSGSNVNESKLYIGVSVTSDPLGDWHFYWIDTDPDNIVWFDYPSMGFNKKWITVSGNMFGNDYYRTVYVIDKMSAYSGDDNLQYTRFTTTNGFTLVPATTYDNESENQYLIATGDGNYNGYGYIKKYKLSGDVNDPVFTYEGDIGIPEPWAGWAGPYGNFLPQLGSNELINSVDARMETVIYRNDKLWSVHHVFLPADNPQRSAVQWWNIDTTGNILEHGRIEDTTNLFSFAFASIAVNAHEDVLVGHSVFSSSQYAGAGYSLKAYYDDPGTMRDYYQYKDGEAPYYKTYGGDRNRWGDYSAACVDPEDDINFWALQEYAMTPLNGDRWGTWWAKVEPSYVPEANFSADKQVIPAGDTINFTDRSLGVPVSWQWTFEGGQPSSSGEQHPQHIVYPNEGTYPVTLIVTNGLGEDTLIKEEYITVSASILPEVIFSADKEQVCVNETVTFVDATLYSPHQWEWQFTPESVTFVNGTNAFSQNPQVEFEEPVTYAVTLTATNLNGSSTDTQFDLIDAGGYQPWFHEDFEGNFTNQHWVIENPDNRITWDLFDIAGNGGGSKAAGVNFRDYMAIGQRDRLISPPINLTGMSNAALEFQHAYAQNAAIPATDSLIVYISDDCGTEWTRLLSLGEDGNGSLATHIPTTDPFFPQTATDWCGEGWGSPCHSIDLTPWAGMADIKVAFETYSFYGNAIIIDNVSIAQYTGVSENAGAEQAVIYPNPTNGKATLDLGQYDGVRSIVVYDRAGSIMLSKQITNEDFVILNVNSNWPAGLYLVNLRTTYASHTLKLIITH